MEVNDQTVAFILQELQDIRRHIRVINDEQGKTMTDVSWLKRWFWRVTIPLLLALLTVALGTLGTLAFIAIRFFASL